MKTLRYTLSFLGLFAAQVLIFNQFLFAGYLNPYLYILFILYLPAQFPRALSLVLAFVIGAGIDFFENSAGVHAAASVFTAFVRPLFFSLLQKSLEGNQDFKLRAMGVVNTLPYFLALLFVHHLSLFLLEAFSFKDLTISALRALYSSLFSYIFVLMYQLWNRAR